MIMIRHDFHWLVEGEHEAPTVRSLVYTRWAYGSLSSRWRARARGREALSLMVRSPALE